MKTLFDFFSPSFLFLLIFPSKAQRSNYFCVSHFLISCKTVKPPPPSVRPKAKEENLQKAKSHKIGPTVPRLATKREKNVNLKRFGFSPNHPGLPTRVNSNNVVLLQRKHQILPKAKLTNLFTMLMCKRCQNANKKIKPIHTSQYFSCSTRV